MDRDGSNGMKLKERRVETAVGKAERIFEKKDCQDIMFCFKYCNPTRAT